MKSVKTPYFLKPHNYIDEGEWSVSLCSCFTVDGKIPLSIRYDVQWVLASLDAVAKRNVLFLPEIEHRSSFYCLFVLLTELSGLYKFSQFLNLVMVANIPGINSAVDFSWIYFWFVNVFLWCLNFATFTKDLLTIIKSWFCIAFWWWDINIFLVLSAFASRPTTLLQFNRASVFFFFRYGICIFV